METKTTAFKKNTEDFIDAVSEHLENSDDLDIRVELELERVLEKLAEIVDYL